MFILKFLRYLRGFVQFRVQGVFIERFLNLVARDRIPVWNGSKRGEVYTGCVKASSYAKMRKHAKKTGVRIRIQEKEGVPFQRRRYRKRAGLLVGLGLFAFFLLAMSGFIWRVEVRGNETITEDRIIAALDDLGVAPGTLRMRINVRDVERKTVLAFQELSWVALNIKGSVIHVEVTERIEPPASIDPNIPCNIVADRPGQILNLQLYDGQALRKKGDAVLPGDIIISGIMEDRLGQNLYRHALADIRAEVFHSLELEVPLAQVEYNDTGNTITRNYLQFLSFELPIFLPRELPSPYKVERVNAPLKFLGFALPITHLKEKYLLMEETPVVFTEEEAKRLALRELTAMEQAEFGDGEIIERTVRGGIQGDVFVIKADYIAHMQIGLEVEIQKESPEK